MKNGSLRSMHLREVMEDKRVLLLLLFLLVVVVEVCERRKIVRKMIRVCASGWRVRRRRCRV